MRQARMRADRRVSARCRWGIDHTEQPFSDFVVLKSFALLAAYGGDVPIEDVDAGDLRAGDVVRVDDPQAHRVERVARVGARVVLEMRPVGLEISAAVRVTLPVDRLVTRLGMAAD
jgi:hypothetical protein